MKKLYTAQGHVLGYSHRTQRSEVVSFHRVVWACDPEHVQSLVVAHYRNEGVRVHNLTIDEALGAPDDEVDDV